MAGGDFSENRGLLWVCYGYQSVVLLLEAGGFSTSNVLNKIGLARGLHPGDVFKGKKRET